VQVGEEWVIDALGCSAARLSDPSTLHEVCAHIIADLNLTVVGAAQWHQFPPPGGVTGLFLLTESHLACHTYPEMGVATFNLYCCHPRAVWPWEARLSSALGATRVIVHAISRGADHNLAMSRDRK
jgi:S-adenosylmethionine decarboxylase